VYPSCPTGPGTVNWGVWGTPYGGKGLKALGSNIVITDIQFKQVRYISRFFQCEHWTKRTDLKTFAGFYSRILPVLDGSGEAHPALRKNTPLSKKK
jgi:hypothetical protein